MKRRTIIIVIIVAAILISVPIYFNYFFRSIAITSEKLILDSNDLPGWIRENHSYDGKDNILLSGASEWSYSSFQNISADNGTILGISVISFESHDSANRYYDTFRFGSSFSIRNTDEARNYTHIVLMPDPDDLNVSHPYLLSEYCLLVDNVVVRMGFQSISQMSSLPANHVSPDWMKGLVELQIDKIDPYRVHIF
jgi:hypothetical protein